MAVRLEGTIKRFIGSSTDEKPRPSAQYGNDGQPNVDRDLPPGSSFLEADTGLIYRWNGLEWVAPAPGPSADLIDLLRSIDGRLAQLVDIVGFIAKS